MPNKRILLVEDDFMNMRLVEHILEREGHLRIIGNGWETHYPHVIWGECLVFHGISVL